MARRLFLLFAAAAIILTPALARAQNSDVTTGNFSKKCFTLAGTVASDGKSLLSDSGSKAWTIVNPVALHDYDGKHVSVRANVNRQDGTLRVTSVRVVPDQTFHARSDDAAFRR